MNQEIMNLFSSDDAARSSTNPDFNRSPEKILSCPTARSEAETINYAPSSRA